MDLSLSEDWLAWGLGLMIAFPLIMVGLGEAILRLEKRKHSMTSVVQKLRTWVIPLSVLFFFLTKVLDLQASTLPLQIVETLAWISVIVVALSFVNKLLFTGAKSGSWQAETPKIFRDLLRSILIATGVAIVLSSVFGVNLQGAFAALGLGSVVIGFALQDTIGNLFSGIALLFEKPFEIGDWLEVEGQTGKVIEVNWRSVHIVTRELEQLIVPNSVLSGAVIRNYNRPQPRHVEPVDIGFSYDDAPNTVKRVMYETAMDTQGVLKHPAPVIQTISYDDFSIAYRVRLFLEDYSEVPRIRDEFVTRIWYAARRNGLSIPFPIRDVFHHHTPKVSSDDSLLRLARYMKSLPSLAMVDDEVLEEMAPKVSLEHFGRNESVIYQGQQDVKVHFVLAGSAIATFTNSQGRSHTIAETVRGDFFGYSALLAREPSPMTVTATSDLEVLVLEVDAVQKMLNKTPRFAQQVSSVIAARQKKLKQFDTEKHQNGSLLSALK